MIIRVAACVVVIAVLCGCSGGMISMDARQAAQVIDDKASRTLLAAPPDAPSAAAQDIAETSCGFEPAMTSNDGITVSRSYIIRPIAPELAQRAMDAFSAELLRQGLEIETDNRNERGPQVIFVDPSNDFRTTVSTAIPGTAVRVTITSPCVSRA